jgi:hypothetical protein
MPATPKYAAAAARRRWIISTKNAAHNVAVMMKPLPSATITAMAGNPWSARFINCAKRSAEMNFGSLS